MPARTTTPCLGLALVSVAAACGPPAPARREPPPRLAVSAEPPSAASAEVVDASAPVREVREACWAGSGPIHAASTNAPALAPLVPTKRYPTVLPILTSDERAARISALGARNPGRTFELDEAGGVITVGVSILPCSAREEIRKIHYVSANTADVMKAFQAELARETPDVPALASYTALVVTAAGTPDTIVFQAGANALAWALPPDLSDDALLAHYAGSRLRWTKEVSRTIVLPNRGNPCAQHRGPMPCDPPGNTREVVEHPVLGERPFTKRYLRAFDRRLVKVVRPGEVEIRKIATPAFDDRSLARDLFGSENSTKTEGVNDITLTGALSRDAITGDPAPAPP